MMHHTDSKEVKSVPEQKVELIEENGDAQRVKIEVLKGEAEVQEKAEGENKENREETLLSLVKLMSGHLKLLAERLSQALTDA